jgi:hypothetical protein
MPHDSSTAPPPIKEDEVEDQCVRCRGDSEVARALSMEFDYLERSERALKGLQLNLPSVFGVSGRVDNVEERIGELRKNFAALHEKAWRELAGEERRERW